MLTVHHLENSRSQRVLWLLEELGLPYDIKKYQRNPKTMLAPPELRKIHPLGKSPVISEGETVVAESGAIIEYLLDRYDNKEALRPAAQTPEKIRYTYWLHYAEGSAMPPLVMSLVFSRLPKSPMPFFIRPVVKNLSKKVSQSYLNPQIDVHKDFLEAELGKSQWFAGENFSAADIQLSYPIEAMAARAGLGSQHPRLRAFVENIRARPAYQRAQEKSGPVDFNFHRK